MEKLIQIPEWQFKKIENALRLTSNTWRCHRRETAFDREVTKAYEFAKDALAGNSVPDTCNCSRGKGISYEDGKPYCVDCGKEVKELPSSDNLSSLLAKKLDKDPEVTYPIGGFAPGYYSCRCVSCGDEFQGDKLACQCEPCATAGVDQARTTSCRGYEPNMPVFDELEDLARRYTPEQINELWELVTPK